MKITTKLALATALLPTGFMTHEVFATDDGGVHHPDCPGLIKDLSRDSGTPVDGDVSGKYGNEHVYLGYHTAGFIFPESYNGHDFSHGDVCPSNTGESTSTTTNTTSTTEESTTTTVSASSTSTSTTLPEVTSTSTTLPEVTSTMESTTSVLSETTSSTTSSVNPTVPPSSVESSTTTTTTPELPNSSTTSTTISEPSTTTDSFSNWELPSTK